jgi:hypothetical protein
MSQTASNPNLATASHSVECTEPKSMCLPAFRLSSESHTQVLISYKVGYCGQMVMLMRFFLFTLHRIIRLFGAPAQHPGIKTNYPTGVLRLACLPRPSKGKVTSLAPLRLLAERTAVSLSESNAVPGRPLECKEESGDERKRFQ